MLSSDRVARGGLDTKFAFPPELLSRRGINSIIVEATARRNVSFCVQQLPTVPGRDPYPRVLRNRYIRFVRFLRIFPNRSFTSLGFKQTLDNRFLPR